MTDTLLRRIVLPIASPEDAQATSEAVFSRLNDAHGSILALYVIEKTEGAPDKASVELQEEYADDIFTVVKDTFSSEGIDVETQLLYGTAVAKTILDAADEFDASAIGFTPRGGSRWVKLLTGDTATRLIHNADRPVITLPNNEAGEDG